MNTIAIDRVKIIITKQDGTTYNLTAADYTTGASNSFTGDVNGNFQSIINPASDTKLEYKLNFTQNINFKLTQNKSSNHTVIADEFFLLMA